MSQLHVNENGQKLQDQMILGVPVPMQSTSGYYWRYNNQQNVFRNGKARSYKLPDDYNTTKYYTNGKPRPLGADGKPIPHKIYIPKHNDWLEDWEGNLMPNFTVPVNKKTREIDWNSINLDLLKKMWLHEYNFKRHYQQMYSIAAKRYNIPRGKSGGGATLSGPRGHIVQKPNGGTAYSMKGVGKPKVVVASGGQSGGRGGGGKATAPGLP